MPDPTPVNIWDLKDKTDVTTEELPEVLEWIISGEVNLDHTILLQETELQIREWPVTGEILKTFIDHTGKMYVPNGLEVEKLDLIVTGKQNRVI